MHLPKRGTCTIIKQANMRKKSANEIKRNADNWMPSVFDAQFIQTSSELRVNPYVDERGIDFAIEIQQTTVAQTEAPLITVPKRTFFVQNKGSDTCLTIRKKGPNKGLLTYSIDRAESLRYLAFDHPSNVCIVTVCDLKSKSLYWCPIQLDYHLYAKEIESFKNSERKSTKIQLRIDPKRCLCRKGRPTKTGFQLLLKDIEDSNHLLYTRQLQERSRHNAGEDAASIVADRKKPLLEQLYLYMLERFGGLHHMPSEFFTQSYPFRVSKSFHSRHDQFTLTIDNEKLIELFKAVKITGPGKVQFTDPIWTKGVAASQKKIRYILKRLSASLVFYIAGHKSREWASVRYSDSEKCDCVRCRIDRLDFPGAFDAISAGVDKRNDLQIMAYSHYQLGNFIESAELLEQARDEYKREEEWSQYVLSSYSLSKLRTHLRSNYWGEQAPAALIERLAKINLETIRMSLPKADKNSRFHAWVDKGGFHSETMYNLYKTVAKIRDHYHSQLQGGWSSNNHIGELIKDFADLDQFLSKDFVYFDRFDEYHQIVDILSEGVFASHAITPDQQSRLVHFDDWIINKLVWYSDPKRLLKYFHRYHIKEIQYKPSASSEESLIAVLSRVLDDAPAVAKTFNKLFDKTNISFVQKYNVLVSNLFVIASISNLDATNVDLIARKLPMVLCSNTLLNRSSMEHIQGFIQRKGKLINKEILKTLLRSIPKMGKLHDEALLCILSEVLIHHGLVALSVADANRFIALTTDKCPLCKHEHPCDWLIPIHRVSSLDKAKKMIEQHIMAQLNIRFEPYLYYEAVMHDVLKVEDGFFNKLLMAAHPVDDQPTLRRAMSGEEDKRRPILDMFINLCFKEAIDLQNERFSGLIGFDSYYDWLLDMGGFNYSRFNVKWVAAYPTRYYFAEIRKHAIIRAQLSAYLKDHRDPQLERAFVDLYRI